jgi:hypothetical protein
MFPFGKNPLESTNSFKLLDQFEEEQNDNAEIIEKFENVVDYENLEYVRHVTIYVAGFVTRRKKLKCEACVDFLSQSHIQSSLISFKDVRGLNYPSDDVIKICQTCETIFRRHADGFDDSSYTKILNFILRQFIGWPIFEKQVVDGTENEVLKNHNIVLIKLVVNTYLDIKFHHKSTIVLSDKISIRNFRHQLTIFEGN